jgi:MFS transporter, MHS family, proline/betaine transporter
LRYLSCRMKIVRKPRLSDSSLFVISAVTVGGTLEWYEIGLFISWPLIIQKNITNFDVSIAESLNTSAIFLVVALALTSGSARAIGGWFFGRTGDKFGRKLAFPLTVLFATIPSLSLSILSFILSYEQWISYSTIIFAVVKFFQGMPAGGELPGAICYLAEADRLEAVNSKSCSKHRYMCSYAMLGPQIGLALSSIVCLILKSYLPQEFLLKQAWKYVFLTSGLIGISGYLMRKHLHETSEYLNLKGHHKISLAPLRTLFKEYSIRVFYGGLLSIFEISAFSVVSVLPLYPTLSSFAVNF